MEAGLAKLAEYGSAGVAIASLLAIYWIVSKFLTFLKESEDRHCITYEKLNNTIDKNTSASERSAESSHEVLEFMRNLNGKLRQAAIEKLAGK